MHTLHYNTQEQPCHSWAKSRTKQWQYSQFTNQNRTSSCSNVKGNHEEAQQNLNLGRVGEGIP